MVLGQEHWAGDRLDRLDDGGDGALDLDALGEPGAAGDRVAACAERKDADQFAGDLVHGILTVRDGAPPIRESDIVLVLLGGGEPGY